MLRLEVPDALDSRQESCTLCGGQGLIRLADRHGLQFDYRLPDALPDELVVAIIAFEHVIGSPGRDYLGIAPAFTGQQIGGSPNVTVRVHSG